MCEAAEVIGEAVGQDVLFRPSYEVAVFQGVAGHIVDVIVGRVRASLAIRVIGGCSVWWVSEAIKRRVGWA